MCKFSVLVQKASRGKKGIVSRDLEKYRLLLDATKAIGTIDLRTLFELCLGLNGRLHCYHVFTQGSLVMIRSI